MSAESWLDLRDVIALTKLCKSNVYAQMKAGRFPAARKRGKKTIWLASEVQQFIATEAATLPKMGPSMGRTPRKRKTQATSAA